MNVIINMKKSGSSTDGLLIKNNEQIEKIRRFLPPETYQKILPLSELANRNGERIEEIRLRCGMRAFATVGLGLGKRNVELPFSLSDDEMSAIVKKMCDGSMYAYTESMIKGYISLGDGIRVGICGKASVENGKILGIYNISSLNIRFPLFCLN